MLEMIYYTYYSYEPFGRGYIGSRGCKCSPMEDEYFGSFTDKTFNPTEKIILTEHQTRKEALETEVKLHEFYQVHINPHFANKAKITSSLFSFCSRGERVGEGNPCFGKVRITDGKNEKVVYENEIPSGWQKGRSRNPKEYATAEAIKYTRGKMYNKFIEDVSKDNTILSLPIRCLAKRYQTTHTSICRWKKSL
jgi:hypothetical protein